MRTLRFMPVCLGFLVLASCVDDAGDAKRRLQQAKEAVSEYAEESLEEAESSMVAVKAKVEALIPAIEDRDVKRLKTVCADLDTLLDTDVMRFYYRTFAIEVKSGPAASKQYLAETLSDPALSDVQKRSLRALKAYFDAKGTISTKDAALTVLAIVLEVKFPHGRGAMLVVPLMDDPGEAFGSGEPQSTEPHAAEPAVGPVSSEESSPVR